MNKEQAIKLFEGLIKDAEQAKTVWELGDTGYYTSEVLISAYNIAISVLKVMDVEEQPKQDKPVVKPFDEPQPEKVEEEPKQEKPVVKQFVADWFEENKQALEGNIYSVPIGIWKKGEQTDFEKWFNDSGTKPFETLIKMKLFGYTVEQPKQWVVKYLRHRCYYYFVEWANTDTFDPIGGPDLDYLKAAKFTDIKKAEAVATLVAGSVEEV